jgi:hypothetical protein
VRNLPSVCKLLKRIWPLSNNNNSSNSNNNSSNNNSSRSSSVRVASALENDREDVHHMASSSNRSNTQGPEMWVNFIEIETLSLRYLVTNSTPCGGDGQVDVGDWCFLSCRWCQWSTMAAKFTRCWLINLMDFDEKQSCQFTEVGKNAVRNISQSRNHQCQPLHDQTCPSGKIYRLLNFRKAKYPRIIKRPEIPCYF